MRPYDEQFAEQLEREGLSPTQARQVAATEMEGADTDRGGFINAVQSYCNVLGYDEALSRSPEAEEAGELYEREIGQWLGPLGLTYEEFMALTPEEMEDKLGGLFELTGEND